MYMSTDMKLGGWTLTMKLCVMPGRATTDTPEGSTGSSWVTPLPTRPSVTYYHSKGKCFAIHTSVTLP